MRVGRKLVSILEAVAARAAVRRRVRSVADLRRELEVDPGRGLAFVDALRTPELSFIAECKRKAPSAGEVDLGERIRAYARRRRGALDPHRA